MTEQKKYKTISERFDEFCEILASEMNRATLRNAFWCHMNDLLNDICYEIGDRAIKEVLKETFAPKPEPKLEDVACRSCGGVDAHEPGCFYAG